MAMNSGLRLLARFVRDLLTLSEPSQIAIGRNNAAMPTNPTLYVVVDQISPSVYGGRLVEFDGTLETNAVSERWTAPCTVSFFGTNAFATASSFVALCFSEAAMKLQRELDLAVFGPSQINDLRWLSGEQFGQRFDVELNISYILTHSAATRRIDSVDVEIETQDGAIYEGTIS